MGGILEPIRTEKSPLLMEIVPVNWVGSLSINDTIELDHFTNLQSVQQLESLVTSDNHGDAMINLGHNDSITLPGVTPVELQQLIQAGHILLH